MLFGGDGNDQLFGGSGGDQIFGSAGNDIVDGGADNDSLVGGSGTDSVLGGLGDDILETGGGLGDTLRGGDGVDRLVNTGGGNASSDVINNRTGYHSIFGDQGDDDFVIVAGFSFLRDWQDGEQIAIDNLLLAGPPTIVVPAVTLASGTPPSLYARVFGGTVSGGTVTVSSITYVNTGVTFDGTSASLNAATAVLNNQMLNDIVEYSPMG
jgi:Ca2+-binding RTX toxin-like protein